MTEQIHYFIFLVIWALLIGSFLNVVIYRLPVMMQRDWRQQAQAIIEQSTNEELADAKDDTKFNLSVPRSRCGSCGVQIKWYENIPVLSYLFLRGKCRNCNTKISLRYPIIEIITAVLALAVVYKFGGDQPFELTKAAGYTIALILFSWLLLVLTMIDFDTQFLPDSITLPGVWLGLFVNLYFDTDVSLHDAVIGAIAGYLALWIVFWIFKLLTGKEGFGYGDFKLLAMIGAWLGWQVLPAVIVISSFAGAIIGGAMMLKDKSKQGQAIAYGPYLAIAGWITLMFGQEINQLYLSLLGI